jgi:hypothetical protein
MIFYLFDAVTTLQANSIALQQASQDNLSVFHFIVSLALKINAISALLFIIF